ncbi:hypothetical protein HK101_008569 [Irineochytrium annulatum]|nr:hypothetical protein HK101_008569 [Irineochytrium annulatum]
MPALHGVMRPAAMATGVVKKRNRASKKRDGRNGGRRLEGPPKKKVDPAELMGVLTLDGGDALSSDATTTTALGHKIPIPDKPATPSQGLLSSRLASAPTTMPVSPPASVVAPSPVHFEFTDETRSFTTRARGPPVAARNASTVPAPVRMPESPPVNDACRPPLGSTAGVKRARRDSMSGDAGGGGAVLPPEEMEVLVRQFLESQGRAGGVPVDQKERETVEGTICRLLGIGRDRKP